MSKYLSIKNSIIALLKDVYPTVDVFFEEIAKMEDMSDSEDVSENYFFVDILPVNITTVSEFHTERSYVINIAAHTENEANEEYIIIAESIDAIIRPVLRFEDRAIIIQKASSRVVDKVLHYTFDLVFMDTRSAPEPPPYMGELQIGGNKANGTT